MLLTVENDIIQSIIDIEVKNSECPVFFDNVEPFLRIINNSVISNFFDKYNTNDSTVNGFFISKDPVNNGFPEQYIFVDNSNSLLLRLSSLIHEIEHYNHYRKIGRKSYNRIKKWKKEYYIYINMAKKILYGNFSKFVKKQLLDNFISQIKFLCKNNDDFYNKAAKKMVRTKIWKECLKVV